MVRGVPVPGGVMHRGPVTTVEARQQKRARIGGFGLIRCGMFSKREGTLLARLIGDDGREWNTPKRERPRCGARCRDGHSCRAPAVWDKENNRPRNGRCRMHGGLSTGPKTLEGKLRALMNLKQFRALASE